MRPRNKINPRWRKKMSSREFICADLHRSWSHGGIRGLGKKGKRIGMFVCYNLTSCWFWLKKKKNPNKYFISKNILKLLHIMF